MPDSLDGGSNGPGHESCALTAADRAAALVARFLAFSRKQVPQPKIFDLNETIVGVEGILRRLIGEHIQLSCELERVPLRVFADPVQLQQVVLNLAVNARDAMPHGGPLTIRTRLRLLNEEQTSALDMPRAGAYVELEVADRGCGMEPAILGRIFEPFFTTKEPGRGTGLGLATAYGIIKQGGGAITAESTPQVGSTFTVLIPLERRLAPRPADQPAVVLALDLLRNPNRHPELLVSDVVMPGMSGPELALAACALRPALKVLFMSGYTRSEVFRDEIAIGGMAFLPKPFTLQEFLNKVRGVLDDRQAPDSGAGPAP